jgi:hypothetical protein
MPSSVVRRFSYDKAQQTLRITFVSGDVYDYVDVPPAVHDGLVAALSKGRYFAAHIRDRYVFRRVRIAGG